MVTERVTGRPCFLVEHWLFIRSCFLFSWLVRSPAGVRNGGAGEGAWWARCWVLREQALSGGWVFLRAGCPGLLVGGPGLVSVRFLRTAQWTRASPVSAIIQKQMCDFVVPSF